MMRLSELSEGTPQRVIKVIENARRLVETLRGLLTEVQARKPLTPEQSHQRNERLQRAQQALSDAQAACARRIARARQRVASV